MFEKRGQVCLSFYYNMFGFHVNLLETVIKRASGRREYPFQMEGQQGRDWRAAGVDFYLNYGDRVSQFIFLFQSLLAMPRYLFVGQ